MLDDPTPTAETNSTPTQTDGSEVDAPPSSATSDALDGASILADAAAEPAEKPSDDGGDPPADGTGETGKDEALTGAPEGDYELTLPEGVAVDADALAAVAPIAKELNLSNAGLSKLAGVYAEQVLPAASKAATDALMGNVVATRAAWDADTRQMIAGGKSDDGKLIPADPMFAGKQLDQVLTTSAKALDRFGGPDFRAFLKETGLGNHPAMVKFAYQAGSLISEDNDFHKSGGVPNTPKTAEEKFYGSA